MAAIATPSPESGITVALIEEIAGGEAGPKLRSQVQRWFPTASRDEVDEAFQEACTRGTHLCRGRTKDEVYVWLRTTTHRCLDRMYERTNCEVATDVWTLEGHQATVGDPEAQVIEAEEDAEIQRLSHDLLGRLTDHQRQVAAMYAHGAQKPEIAARLGLTPKSVKRALERVLAAGRDELSSAAGRGCKERGKLVSRFAFGLTSQRESQAALAHLTSCSACTQLLECLDVWRSRVASVLPVPPAAVGEHQVDVIEPAAHGLRDRLVEALTSAKQNLAGVASRGMDPTPVAGARPGAAVAAIAGCIAIGSGATYCVKQSTSPVSALSGLVVQKKSDTRRATKPPRTARPAVAPQPVVSAAPTVTSSKSSANTSSRPKREQPKRPAPSAADEFEPTQSNAGAATSATAASSTPQTAQSSVPTRRPAPASPSGGGEFEP